MHATFQLGELQCFLVCLGSLVVGICLELLLLGFGVSRSPALGVLHRECDVRLDGLIEIVLGGLALGAQHALGHELVHPPLGQAERVGDPPHADFLGHKSPFAGRNQGISNF